MRVLALDVGSVRIGVAVSDPLGIIAQGIGFWRAEGDWKKELAESIAKYRPAVLLLGLPIRTTGERGPEAEHILRLANSLRTKYPEITVETWDERFTTKIAEQTLLEGDASRRKRKGKIDMIAATLILQSWLDQRDAKV